MSEEESSTHRLRHWLLSDEWRQFTDGMKAFIKARFVTDLVRQRDMAAVAAEVVQEWVTEALDPAVSGGDAAYMFTRHQWLVRQEVQPRDVDWLSLGEWIVGEL